MYRLDERFELRTGSQRVKIINKFCFSNQERNNQLVILERNQERKNVILFGLGFSRFPPLLQCVLFRYSLKLDGECAGVCKFAKVKSMIF